MVLVYLITVPRVTVIIMVVTMVNVTHPPNVIMVIAIIIMAKLTKFHMVNVLVILKHAPTKINVITL